MKTVLDIICNDYIAPIILAVSNRVILKGVIVLTHNTARPTTFHRNNVYCDRNIHYSNIKRTKSDIKQYFKLQIQPIQKISNKQIIVKS
jgi:ribosomal protein L24